MQKIKWSSFRDSEQMLDYLNVTFPEGSSLDRIMKTMIDSGAKLVEGSDAFYFRYTERSNLFVKTVWIVTVKASEGEIISINVKKDFIGL